MISRLSLLAAVGLAASSAPAAAAPAAADPTCSKAAVIAAGAAARSARARLSALPPGADDSSVTPAARLRIEATKDRLRDFVRAAMDCAPLSAEPGWIQDALIANGGSFVHAVPLGPEDAYRARHGDRLVYQVTHVPGHPQMLAVVATLGIHCGTDSMLLLYRRSGTGWEEAMVRRSAPYTEIRGGWSDLRFAVSPPDKDGRWFVATASTTPWCTSAWQGLPYELARPGPTPDRPRVFFRGKATIYLGRDEDLSIKAQQGAFEIRHNGGSLDPDILIRRHVRRYSVTGESVARMQPVAENVRDFADEWIDSPWAEAKQWSGSHPALAAAHSGLRAARYETLGGFASIRACADGRTQVELAGQDGPGWFLLVRGDTDGPWTMERAARQAVAGCTGPDRLGKG